MSSSSSSSSSSSVSSSSESALVVEWTAGELTFRGITYNIAAGGTDKKYIYWDPNYTTIFRATDNLQDVFDVEGWVMCINDEGAVHIVFGIPVLHGGLLQVRTVIADKLLVLGLDNDGKLDLGQIGAGDANDVPGAATTDKLALIKASLLPNWCLDMADLAGRPAGIYPTDSITDFSQLDWLDSGKAEIKILSTPDTHVGYGFPAIPIDDKQKYTIVIRHKSSAASTNGLYLLFFEYDAAKPAGKTHIGNANGGTNCQTRSRAIELETDAAMPGTSWIVDTYTYTPTAGVKYASFSMHNVTPNTPEVEYHVDYVLMYPVPKDADQIAESATNKWAAESGADITGNHEGDISLANLDEKSVDSLVDGTYAKMLAVWKHASDPTKLDLSKGFAASITTAQIGLLAVHTGQINNLAVDTLQVADNAVTIPESVYTVGATTDVIQILTIISTGAPIFIFTSFVVEMPYVQWLVTTVIKIERGEGADPESWDEIYNSGNITLFSGYVQSHLMSISFTNTPGSGTFTYRVTETGSGSFRNRSLLLLETKK